jgi:hypothetical protein
MTAKEFLQKRYLENDHYYGDEFWYSLSINEMQYILEEYHRYKLKSLGISNSIKASENYTDVVMDNGRCPECGIWYDE